MVAHFMATSKANQIDKWQRSKQNTSGSKQFLEYTISTSVTSHTETSNQKIYFLMKLGPALNLLILVFLRVFLMRKKSRYFVERHHTWPQRSLARQSMLDRQLIYGLQECFCMRFCVDGFHLKDKMIRNFTQIYASKSYPYKTTSLAKDANFC